MDEYAFKKGAELLRKMLDGQDEEVRRTWHELAPEFEQYVVSFVAGEIWARPGLPLKTRSLITVAAVAAMGRREALALNLRMALNNGATRQELVETLLQIAPYAGFPACWDALTVLNGLAPRQPEKQKT